MRPDPLLPDPLTLGPTSRYAALPEAELAAWCRRLAALVELWSTQVARFRSAGVTTALGGPCARALTEAHEALLAEASALRVELETRMAEVREAVAG